MCWLAAKEKCRNVSIELKWGNIVCAQQWCCVVMILDPSFGAQCALPLCACAEPTARRPISLIAPILLLLTDGHWQTKRILGKNFTPHSLARSLAWLALTSSCQVIQKIGIHPGYEKEIAHTQSAIVSIIDRSLARLSLKWIIHFRKICSLRLAYY